MRKIFIALSSFFRSAIVPTDDEMLTVLDRVAPGISIKLSVFKRQPEEVDGFSISNCCPDVDGFTSSIRECALCLSAKI